MSVMTLICSGVALGTFKRYNLTYGHLNVVYGLDGAAIAISALCVILGIVHACCDSAQKAIGITVIVLSLLLFVISLAAAIVNDINFRLMYSDSNLIFAGLIATIGVA